MLKGRRAESNIEVSLNKIDRNTWYGDRKRMLFNGKRMQNSSKGSGARWPSCQQSAAKGVGRLHEAGCLTVKQALPARPGIFPDACAPPRHMEILIKKKKSDHWRSGWLVLGSKDA